MTLNGHSHSTSIFGGAPLILSHFSLGGRGGIVSSRVDAGALRDEVSERLWEQLQVQLQAVARNFVEHSKCSEVVRFEESSFHC